MNRLILLLTTLFAVAVAIESPDDEGVIPVTTEANVDTTPANWDDSSIIHWNGTNITSSTPASTVRSRRNVLNMFAVMTCTRPSCNPMSYESYGCYCGKGGSGTPVDYIDRCCQEHDACYDRANCGAFPHLITYKYECDSVKQVFCRDRYSSCESRICRCDVEFADCLKQYHCPAFKEKCPTSKTQGWLADIYNSWQFFQILRQYG